MLYGAIVGDIVGSRFEFDKGPWTKDFDFITEECDFTDDTVMTIAVANGLMCTLGDSEEVTKDMLTMAMRSWGTKYPYAGYGVNFSTWLNSKDPKPYNSFGNGSAMRVSAVGWLYDSLEETKDMARVTAEITHDHPEGIRGAVCTASVIYLARNGYYKYQIEDYLKKEFAEYDISESLESMRARHKHDESCMDSMPKALVSFLKGETFTDVIRNAVSLGGDADTIAAIAGSMAEAYYAVPYYLEDICRHLLPREMLDVIDEMERVVYYNSLGK